MNVIESGILGGQEDWKRITGRQIDGKRGGGTRKLKDKKKAKKT